MDKTVKSIAEQINLLKSRKVIINNERLAARILKYENYYYLKLLRIEHSIKACIVDVFSNHHGEKHTNYLRPESFNSEAFSNFKRTNALIFDLLRLIEKERKRHDAIEHYMEKYGYVPL